MHKNIDFFAGEISENVQLLIFKMAQQTVSWGLKSPNFQIKFSNIEYSPRFSTKCHWVAKKIEGYIYFFTHHFVKTNLAKLAYTWSPLELYHKIGIKKHSTWSLKRSIIENDCIWFSLAIRVGPKCQHFNRLSLYIIQFFMLMGGDEEIVCIICWIW